jgi:putative ABC transport system ATP-binding protein
LSRRPVYELRDVSKTFRQGALEVRALREVTLAVDGGEFLVVVGPSGSGKTTLLQLLGVLDRPTSGSLLYDGADLARLGDCDLTRLRRNTFGFVFQQFNLIPTLTALQNVEVAMNGNKPRARWLLEQVGLGARGDHLPAQLSGGEQQRVAIARALANEPDVLLADEPTGNLDTTTGEEIMGVLRGLWEGGLSVVLITHDPAIAGTAPRVVQLRDGRVQEAVIISP